MVAAQSSRLMAYATCSSLEQAVSKRGIVIMKRKGYQMAKPKKGASPIDPNESKLDRFHRVAEPRIRKALKAIDLVIACTNKATYEVAPEDVERIQKAFAAKIQSLANAFSGVKESEESFSFRR